MGIREAVPGSQFPISPTLVITAIWEVNQWMEDLSPPFCSICLSNKNNLKNLPS